MLFVLFLFLNTGAGAGAWVMLVVVPALSGFLPFALAAAEPVRFVDANPKVPCLSEAVPDDVDFLVDFMLALARNRFHERWWQKVELRSVQVQVSRNRDRSRMSRST